MCKYILMRFYVCIYVCTHVYIHIYVFTYLFIHIYINTCVYTHRGIISSYPRSLSQFDTLSLYLTLSLLHVRSPFHFVPLSAPPPRPHFTKQHQHGENSSNAPCAYVCTIDGAGNQRPACGVGSNCNTLQHAHTISLSFLSLSPPPLSLAFPFPLIH